MRYQQTTPVPNIIFDTYLPLLTGSEFKVLSIIIRQTYGWVDKETGKRKTRDRISHSQFVKKTGLSRRVVSKSIQSLVAKDLVRITDQADNSLHRAEDRKGTSWMFYTLTLGTVRQESRRIHGVRSVGEILRSTRYQ